jgi:hypothetical protein
VEHFGAFEYLRGRVTLFEEVDGIFGKFMGLVGFLFEYDGGEERASNSLHGYDDMIILLM